MKKDYTIGLDIGTNSVGWAVVKDDYDLVKKKMKIQGNTDQKAMKKNFWGVRLFDEGQTAADRRLKRTTKRRYIRRANRLSYLQDIFTPEMKAFDENFFYRLQDSFLVPEEKSGERHPIFGTIEEEVAYHEKYPTIYHLRKELADKTEKADLRLVYLALAHITKYRGHFLIEGDLDAENSSVQETFKIFIEAYNEAFVTEDVYSDDQEKITAIDPNLQIEEVAQLTVSRSKKAEWILNKVSTEKSNGTFAQFVKMIVGNQGNFKKTFGLDEDAKIIFSKETYEEDRDELLSITSDDYAGVFLAAKNVYDAMELSSILKSTTKNTNAKLSASMIERYDQHRVDLAELKEIVRQEKPEKYPEIFKDKTKNGYAGYIDGKTTQEDFYKYLKKELGTLPSFESCLVKIDQETYLRKQRTFDNGVIPHQIHLLEMRAILNNQGTFYPFIKENTEKICQIFKFRIPYYIGPLAQEEGNFAWLTRKSDEPIRPWNFKEVVDEYQSSEDFIERMTNFDTYLPNQKVLPKHSLLYQKYTVYNELTKVQYKNEQNKIFNFSGTEKQEIVNALFKKKRKVTEKALLDYLENELQIQGVSIVSGIEKSFNAHLGTYHDLRKLKIDSEFLDNQENEAIIEEIIKLLTIFEDRTMIRSRLKQYETIFSPETLKAMERRHYTGWGRLSQELINGIRDQETGKTILEFLIEDDGEEKHINRNLMQLINDPHLSFKEEITKCQLAQEATSLQEKVANLPGSPAIKKGILQSLKVIEELVEIMGYEPKAIVVEMARENQQTNRKASRLKKLEKLMNEMQSDLLKEYPTTNEALRDNRLFLYYLQNGKDMYTEQELSLANLSNYDLDHIIPQSFIKDDSLDNLVLVSSKENRGKSDDVPSEEVVRARKRFWQTLLDSGLLTERKFKNLTKAERGGLTDGDREGFIKRQLVETRQITKHVAQLLDQRFNTERDEQDQVIRKVDILSLKSSLTSSFRKDFKLYKVREVNDYHHAHDAYLNVVVGNTLMKVYPQLKAEFVYGEYNKNRIMTRFSATEKKNFYSNLTRFFTSSKPKVNDLGEVLWSPRDVAQVKKVLGYHQMNIVKKVEKQSGQLTNEGVFPAGQSDKLLARKKDWDPKKYGGVQSPTISYSILVSSLNPKTKNNFYEIIGIPLLYQSDFENNKEQYLMDKGFLDPKICFELPKYSLFELSNGKKRMISSAQELQKANQMILPPHLLTLMYYSKETTKGKNTYLPELEKCREDYQELLDFILNFSEKHTSATKNEKKIRETFEKNKSGDIVEIAQAFTNLMRLNQKGAPAEFKFFDVNIPRRRYTTKSDVNELFDGCIVHQSITGLFESKWKL